MVFYTDGSSTIGVKSAHCVVNEAGKVLAYTETIPYRYTSNEEEYRGVIAALGMARVNKDDVILSDSMLIVNQLTGKFKVNSPNLIKLHKEALKLKNEKSVEILWIRRCINLAGIVFEKKVAPAVGDIIV